MNRNRERRLELPRSPPLSESVREGRTACSAGRKPAATPETEAIRKALGGISNSPLLLSLLQYYASEARKTAPSQSMLKMTKEQIMKHWPQLAFTPLFGALDGAVC